MKHIKTYATAGQIAPVVSFLDELEPKFREKLIWQIFQLSHTPRSMLKEPHYTGDAESTLFALGYEWKQIEDDARLRHGLEKAQGKLV